MVVSAIRFPSHIYESVQSFPTLRVRERVTTPHSDNNVWPLIDGEPAPGDSRRDRLYMRQLCKGATARHSRTPHRNRRGDCRSDSERHSKKGV